MPATPQELADAARQVAREVLAPDFVAGIQWADGTPITEAETRNLFTFACYEIRQMHSRRPKAQRKALRLLRTLLTPEQREQLKTGQQFRVVGSAGGVYRLYPSTGQVCAVERHGARWYGVRTFCLHELEEPGIVVFPSADRTIAHLLLLSAAEPEFLALANATDRRPDCWNGEYLRRLRRARRERARNAPEDSGVLR